MCVYLRPKFQNSNIILTSFREGVNFTLPHPQPLSQNEPLKSKNPPILELNKILLVRNFFLLFYFQNFTLLKTVIEACRGVAYTHLKV